MRKCRLEVEQGLKSAAGAEDTGYGRRAVRGLGCMRCMDVDRIPSQRRSIAREGGREEHCL